MQEFVFLGKGLYIGPVGLANCLAGFAGLCLLFLRGAFGGLGGKFSLRLYIGLLGSPDLCHQRILHIHRDVVTLRHFSVEVHSAAKGAHLTVTAHEFVLGDKDGGRFRAKVVSLHEVVVALR